jgi:hypothetical protein
MTMAKPVLVSVAPCPRSRCQTEATDRKLMTLTQKTD